MSDYVHSEFNCGGLPIATRFEQMPGADLLTVVLNGYCDRIAVQPPAFVHWPAGPVFGHILRISDPTLLLSDWQKGACFIGTEDENPIPSIVEHCNDFAGKLGISGTRTIYFGNSGAGFGAVQCAIWNGLSPAIATNPLLELDRFVEYNFGNDSAKLFRPQATLAELCLEYPDRFSVSAHLQRARTAGKRPKLALIQNISDVHHYESHYGDFCRMFGVPKEGGSDDSGDILSAVYDAPEGHSSIPRADLIEMMLAKCCDGAAPVT